MKYLKQEAEKFRQDMADIVAQYGDEREACHVKMDELMCRQLRRLGFEAGVEIFENADIFYA
ncbi:MAG: hypothetical protein DBY43_05565 [Clostridiaceae bacterium]|nr:MAG: hypothetical protein DBY43_05565 [Clostridiaceae bacterium]